MTSDHTTTAGAALDELRSTIEALETSCEELKTANEVVTSVNEELQSTNKELKTAKEELITLNGQLQDKIAVLTAAHDDLANLLSSTAIATLFLDTQLRVKLFTPAAQAVFKLIHSDLGRPLSDISATLDVSELLADAHIVLEQLTPIEKERLTSDQCCYLCRVLPYRTQDERICGVVITLIDISDRKRADEGLRRLSTVVLEANDAIIVEDFDGKILAWNRGAHNIYGWSETEALALNARERIPPAQQQEMVALIEQVGRGETVNVLSTQRFHKDGHLLDIELTATPLQGDDGRPNALATTERDISVRLQAERALRAEKEFSEQLIRSMPGMVLLLDPEGRIKLFNPGMECITGYRADEVLSLDWFDRFIPASDRATLRHFFAEINQEGINHGFTNPILDKAGHTHTIEWYGGTIKDADGNLLGLLNIGHDITELRASAKALIEAKKSAEQANTDKSRFLAAASHDLRQPLQTLNLLNGVLALKVGNDEKLRLLVGKQADALSAMEGMLNALLDINQLESGAICPHHNDFPVAALLAQLKTDFTNAAVHKGLKLRFIPSRIWLNSDQNLLTEILRNIIGNAIKYTQQGKIVVGCRRRSDMVRIEVWDTGIGFTENHRQRIFEAFFQLNNPARNHREGLGLGLAIVERLTRLLGHQLEVQSTPGKGSLFAITVPCAEATTHTRKSATCPSSAVSKSNAQDAAILYIEDDPDSLEAAQMLLELAGYHLITATDGAAALALVSTADYRPDLIISDQWLPDHISGSELVQQLNKLLSKPVPVILLTGDLDKTLQQKANRLGYRVLYKPVDSDALIQAIDALLA